MGNNLDAVGLDKRNFLHLPVFAPDGQDDGIVPENSSHHVFPDFLLCVAGAPLDRYVDDFIVVINKHQGTEHRKAHRRDNGCDYAASSPDFSPDIR